MSDEKKIDLHKEIPASDLVLPKPSEAIMGAFRKAFEDPSQFTETVEEVSTALQRASDVPPAEKPLDPYISFDDFQKVVIKVGQVIEANRIEKSKGGKLLQLTVDFNEPSKRVVVSGIGLSFAPETLVGQKFAFVTNLKPTKLMGIESQAMILATGPSPEALSLAQLPDTVANGSRLG